MNDNGYMIYFTFSAEFISNWRLPYQGLFFHFGCLIKFKTSIENHENVWSHWQFIPISCQNILLFRQSSCLTLVNCNYIWRERFWCVCVCVCVCRWFNRNDNWGDIVDVRPILHILLWAPQCSVQSFISAWWMTAAVWIQCTTVLHKWIDEF